MKEYKTHAFLHDELLAVSGGFFGQVRFLGCVFLPLPFLSYAILLQRMDSSLPFPPTHLPNTNRFNRWGVTLRDTLNTMYIMGRDDDFEDAIGLWGILLSLCRPYVLPTFSLSLLPFHFSPSSLLPSSSSPSPFLSLLTPP